MQSVRMLALWPQCRAGRHWTEGGERRLTGLLLALTLGVLGWTSGHGDSVGATDSKFFRRTGQVWETGEDKRRRPSVSLRDCTSTEATPRSARTPAGQRSDET